MACTFNCNQGRACLCGLVTASPHGRTVDTEIHEAPQPARACKPEASAMRLTVAFRLFTFYRKSGLPFTTAIASAWAKSK